jgi:hypothetical protein
MLAVDGLELVLEKRAASQPVRLPQPRHFHPGDSSAKAIIGDAGVPPMIGK